MRTMNEPGSGALLFVLWGEEFAIGGKEWDFTARFGKRWREIHRFSRCPSVTTFRTRKNHRKSKQRCSSFSKSGKTEDPTKQSHAAVSDVFRLTEYRLDVVSTPSPAC